MSNLHGTLVAGEAVSGNYEILDVAGSGGMGVVYRALDRRLKRTVALKFLPAQLSDSPRDRERFLREARTASSLDHPNIGIIYGVEETAEGHGFIVMAYYDGQSLARHICDGPLSEFQAVDIATQMACGLAEAHARQVIHRDIKPSNVMLTRTTGSGERTHIRIVDFGLAQVIAQQTATSSGAQGTIHYMSPEQAQEKHTDARTDIWSLGVTLAEMLTGRHPFARETLSATLLAILSDPPSPMHGVHPALQEIVYRALAKDRACRYLSMSELLADLERVRPLLTAPPDAPSGALTRSLPGSLATVPVSPQLQKALQRASEPVFDNSGATKIRWPRIAAVLVGLASVTAIMLSIAPMRERLEGIFRSGPEKHIAVLPFVNVNEDAGDAVLVDGLMNSLSDRLSNLDAGKDSLWVVPGSEVQRLKISDPADALNKLGATLVVRGSVNKRGQYVQLTVNLIDSRKLRQMGSVEVESADGNIAGLETQAVSSLARMMDLKVPEAAQVPSPSAPEAYVSYLTALGYLQRYDKAGNLDLAIAELKRSIAIDPKFAVSYARLGEAYRMKSEINNDSKWRADAEAYCRKAVQLDPDIAGAYVTLGELHHRQQQELAMQEYRHALALDNHNAAAESGMAAIYVRTGRLAEAEAAYQKTIDLQPEDWTGYDELGNYYDSLQRYHEAIAAYRQAQRLTPDNAEVMINLAVAEINSNDSTFLVEAENLLKRSISINPTYQAYANLALIYQQNGRNADAAAVTERALAINDKDYVVWANLIAEYEWLKREDKVQQARQKGIAVTEQAIREDPGDATAQAVLADEYAHAGHAEQALAHIHSAQALAPDDPVVLVDIADSYEGLGDHGRALAVLKVAMGKGFSLAALRSDPEAQTMVAEIVEKH